MADLLTRTASSPMMDDCRFAHIIILESSSLEFVIEIKIFGIHKIIFAVQAHFPKNLPSQQHTCSWNHVHFHYFDVIGKQRGYFPKPAMRPAQAQILGIDRLV